MLRGGSRIFIGWGPPAEGRHVRRGGVTSVGGAMTLEGGSMTSEGGSLTAESGTLISEGGMTFFRASLCISRVYYDQGVII